MSIQLPYFGTMNPSVSTLGANQVKVFTVKRYTGIVVTCSGDWYYVRNTSLSSDDPAPNYAIGKIVADTPYEILYSDIESSEPNGYNIAIWSDSGQIEINIDVESR